MELGNGILHLLLHIKQKLYVSLPHWTASSIKTRTTSIFIFVFPGYKRILQINRSGTHLFLIVLLMPKGNLSYIFYASYDLYNFCLITVNYSKNKSAHINKNDLCQHQFSKEPITHECRSLLFCANENTHIAHIIRRQILKILVKAM